MNATLIFYNKQKIISPKYTDDSMSFLHNIESFMSEHNIGYVLGSSSGEFKISNDWLIKFNNDKDDARIWATVVDTGCMTIHDKVNGVFERDINEIFSEVCKTFKCFGGFHYFNAGIYHVLKHGMASAACHAVFSDEGKELANEKDDAPEFEKHPVEYHFAKEHLNEFFIKRDLEPELGIEINPKYDVNKY